MESDCLLMNIHRVYLVFLRFSANKSDMLMAFILILQNQLKTISLSTFLKHKKPQNIIYSSCLVFNIYKSFKNPLFVPSLIDY